MAVEEFEEYLTQLNRQMSLTQEEHQAIVFELQEHLEQQLQDLIQQGWNRPAAIDHCLKELGSTHELASKLSQANRWKENRERFSMVIVAAACFLASMLIGFRWFPEIKTPQLHLPHLEAARNQKATLPVALPQNSDQSVRRQLEHSCASLVPANLPLDLFLQQLLNKTEIQFHIALDDAQREESSKKTLSLVWSIPNIRLRTALEILLPSVGLSYRIREGLLVIGSATSFQNVLVSRRYMIRPIDEPRPLTSKDLDDLIVVIRSCVAPDSWQRSIDSLENGIGEIHVLRNELIVSQSEDVHQELQFLLEQLGARASP